MTSVAALMATGLFTWGCVPRSATPDERELLRLTVASKEADKDCVAFFTSADIFGGTYGFDTDVPNQSWDRLNAIDDRAQARRISLIANVNVDGTAVTNLWDERRCITRVTLQTPRVSGRFGFVNYHSTTKIWNYYSSDHGSYAYFRSKHGWRHLAYKSTRDGAVE